MRTILRKLLVKVSIPGPDDVEDQLARRHSHRPPRITSAEPTIGLPLAGNVHSIRLGRNKRRLSQAVAPTMARCDGAWNPHLGLVYRPPARAPKLILSVSSSVSATGFQHKKLYQISTSQTALVPEPPAFIDDRIPLSLCVPTRPPGMPPHPDQIILVILSFLSHIRLSSLSYLCD